jgi:hypothetical protein
LVSPSRKRLNYLQTISHLLMVDQYDRLGFSTLCPNILDYILQTAPILVVVAVTGLNILAFGCLI